MFHSFRAHFSGCCEGLAVRKWIASGPFRKGAIAAGVMIAAILGGHPTSAVAQERGSVDVVEYRGVVEPVEEAEIAPLFDGWLTDIHFMPGEYVEEGDLLFEFSKGERELLMEMDRAALKRARAELSRAEQALARSERLSERAVISDAELANDRLDREVAAANVQQAEIKVEMSELIMNFLNLRAPISGIISRPYVMENAYLTKDAREETRMATIAQLDPIWVVAEVPYEVYARRRGELETDRAAMNAVDLSLVLPDGSVYPHKGRYRSGGYAFDEEAQTASVWAEFPNPDHLLRPGLSVTVRSTLEPGASQGASTGAQ